MDPLSIVAISGAVGGAAGKLVEKAWDSGEKWLGDYFKDHHQKAQETARQNSLKFLNNLAERVHRLEEETKDDPKIKEKIISALQNPDFSALLKDALIASSRTDNAEKHKILARIVSERLSCHSEGLLALTSTLACDAVKHLTPKQMRFLGITSFTYFIRPNPFPPDITPQQFSQWYLGWLTRWLSLYLPIELLKPLDFHHLEAVSCIKYETFIGRSLKEVLGPRKAEYDWPFDDFIKNTPSGKQLNELWEKGMQQTTLTTTGNLIGIYVNDELTKTRTSIDW